LIRKIKRRSSHDTQGMPLSERLSNAGHRFRRGLFRATLVLTALFLLYTIFGGTYGFVRIARLETKKRQLAKENHLLLTRLIDADMTRQRLENDLNYIEYVARTQHYFTRPGEVIYRFKE
jgi:cell division protein FtsB